MGHSVTIHCIGYGPQKSNGDGTCTQRVYYAMNRVEIAQELEKARRKGEIILEWSSQTKTGARILGDDLSDFWPIKTESIKLPKMVICPICQGQGTKPLGPQIVRSCVICNGSGITRPGNWNKWQEWQLENIKKEFSEGRES